MHFFFVIEYIRRDLTKFKENYFERAAIDLRDLGHLEGMRGGGELGHLGGGGGELGHLGKERGRGKLHSDTFFGNPKSRTKKRFKDSI